MKTRRSLGTAAVLAVAFTVQVAYASPVLSGAVAAALSCCSGNCHEVKAEDAAARCCRIDGGLQEAATLSAAKKLQPDATYVAVFSPAPPRAEAPQRTFVAAHSPPERAGPLFLLTRSLRL